MEPQIEKRKSETKPVEVNVFNWQVPQCCREGWDSCKHCVKRIKPKKRNVGL